MDNLIGLKVGGVPEHFNLPWRLAIEEGSFNKADQEGWNTSKLKFNVIGDIYGGLWALEHNEAQAFLWEKYTTFPFTEQKKCRYIDEVVTPWPCFVIAVRKEIYDQYPKQLKQMCDIVNAKALEVKNDENSSFVIGWRYNLRKDQVQKWLYETDWNYTAESFPEEFENTINYLKKLNLISEENTENWEQKLF
ncbi:MAG: hypothetical protein LW701_08145 [Fluviicola sp.]|nr:hypothetical protein [Fluviicola sp.]